MPFSALQCEEMFAERPFCLFTPGEVFLEQCKKFPRFSNFNLLIQKNGKFWSVCTVFDRKRKSTENGKSAKRNLNFVKQRNGGLSLNYHFPSDGIGWRIIEKSLQFFMVRWCWWISNMHLNFSAKNSGSQSIFLGSIWKSYPYDISWQKSGA